MRALQQHPIVRGLVGGLVLSVASALMLPILLSGEERAAMLVDRATEIGDTKSLRRQRIAAGCV